MKHVAPLIALLLMTGCAAPVKAPGEGNQLAPPVPSSTSATGSGAQFQPTTRRASIQIEGATYRVNLPDGAADTLLAVATSAGVAWVSPQAEVGEGVYKRPTDLATLWLSPVQKDGGSLEQGRRELFTFPLTIPWAGTGEGQYVQVSKLAPAGDWVAVMLFLHLPGTGNGRGRLDAVNVKTGAHLVISDASVNGGMHFIWRASPGRIYWEQQSLTATGDPLVVTSKEIDLATGTVTDVPPGTAKNP